MSNPAAPAEKAGGLNTVLNTIASPKEAFEAIRVAPTWGWAFLIAAILGAIGIFLMLPVIQHSSEMAMNADPRMAQMSADQLAAAKKVSAIIINFTPLFTIIGLAISLLIQTVIMLIFNVIGRGSAGFKTLWAAAANIAVPTFGIATIIGGVIARVRGADAFTTPQAVQQIMPSLAWIAPNANHRLVALLSVVTPFSLWAAGLTIAAMLIVARVRPGLAWATGIVGLLIGGLVAAAFAR
jgi:hypothetical protein